MTICPPLRSMFGYAPIQQQGLRLPFEQSRAVIDHGN